MPRKSHTHKYIKRETSSSPVWACALEDCNHYMPSHLSDLVVGRSSFCWQCGEKFRLTSESVKEDMPRCDYCRHGINRISKPINESRSELSKVLDEIEIIESKD